MTILIKILNSIQKRITKETDYQDYQIYNILSIVLFSYIIYMLVVFYSISTVVGYLMPNPVYTYILNIYDL